MDDFIHRSEINLSFGKNVHAGWAAVRAAKQCPHLPRLGAILF
jgi:hypothetical protein